MNFIITAYNTDKYIVAIKNLRASRDPAYMSLRDAKDAVDRLRDRNGPIIVNTSLPSNSWNQGDVFTVSPIDNHQPNKAVRDFILDVLSMSDPDTARSIRQLDSYETLIGSL